MPEKQCPSVEDLRAFALGQLRWEDIDVVAGHVETCLPCEDTIASLEAQGDTVVTGLRTKAKSKVAENNNLKRALSFVKKIGEDASRGAKPTKEAEPPIGNLREYELLEKLGEGGMGAVYKARHSKLDKIVAIKVLPKEKMKDAQAVARFEREMRAVGKLEHPNIVRAMDAGEVDGMHFLVMEYVQGLDLSQISRLHGPLAIADACELIRQAAVGLDEAYDHDMVHRDIKPSNLILAQRRRKPPVVKVLDMGLAMLSDAHAPDMEGLTTTGQMMGTLDYMAPEQGGDSKNVDIRADIYALGASLYRLLTGEVIYHGEKYNSPVQKMMALAVEPAPAIQTRRAGIPDELAAIVHKMLEKSSNARYATPQEVADALAPFCGGADLEALLVADISEKPSISSAFTATELGASSGEVDTDTTLSVGTGCQPVPEAPTTSPIAQSKPQSAAGTGKLPVPKWLAIGGGLLGLLLLLAATVFFLQTPHGTLRVEIDDPEIEVKIQGEDIILTNADKEPIKLKAGEHTLIVTRGDDFTFETKQLILKKGETRTVKVELLPGKIQVVSAGETIGAMSFTPGSTLATGGMNYALHFDGESSLVQVDDFPWNAAEPLTLEVIATPLAVDSQGCVVGLINDQTMLHVMHQHFPQRGRSNYWSGGYIEGTRSTYVVSENQLATNNKPVHLAFVHEDEKVSLFVDGKAFVSKSNAEFKFQLGKELTGLVLGHGPVASGNHPWFAGTIHELRVSTCVRDKREFGPRSTSHRFNADGDTLALYHFDEGSGDVLHDSSGNGHHGKIVGAKWVRLESESQRTADYALEFLGNSEPGKRYGQIPLPDCPSKPPLTIEGMVHLRPDFTPKQVNWHVWSWWRQPSLNLRQASGKDSDYWFFQATTASAGRSATCEKVRPEPGPHHMAIVWDTDGSSTLFVDGIAHPCDYSVRSVDQGDESAEQQLILGGGRDGEVDISRQFDGLLDELRISDVARYSENFIPLKPDERFTPDEHTLALYHFDEGSGDVLHDSSGNNHHGKIVGAKWVKVDAVQKDFELEIGRGGFVNVDEIPLGDLAEFTLELYATPATEESRHEGYQHLIRLGRSRHLVLTSSGEPYWFGKLTSGENVGVKANPLDKGKRVHISLVGTSDEVRLFVDGKLADRKTLPHPLANPDDALQLGELFNGRIDEARLSTVARYETDFTPAPRFETDQHTLALYHFDEGAGDVLKDSSGNNHHGKIVGAKWVRVDDVSHVNERPPRNYALQFDGNDLVRLDRGNADPLNYTGEHPLTIECVATPTELHNSIVLKLNHVLLLQRELPSGDYVWNAFVKSADGKLIVDSKVPLKAGQSYHLAIVLDAGSLRLWVDGVEDNLALRGKRLDLEDFDDIPEAKNEGGAAIGGWTTKFTGIIDEVRISDVARYSENYTPAQRLASDNHTLSLYHFDEGEGDVLHDSSGHNRHGIIGGAKWVRVNPEAEPKVSVVRPSEPAVLDELTAEQRKSLEWVLSVGGTLSLVVDDKESTYTAKAPLPARPFRVSRLNLSTTEAVDSDTVENLKDLPLVSWTVSLGPPVDDDALAKLMTYPGIIETSNVNLDGSLITDDGLVHLQKLAHPWIVSLAETGVSAKGLAHLGDSTFRGFTLRDCQQINDDACPHLVALPALRWLNVEGTSITDAGLKELAGCKWLEVLHVRRCDVSEAAVKQFAATRPKCRIIWDGGTIVGAESVRGGDALDSDRAAAEYVLSLGGKIRTDAEGFKDDELPDVPFRLTTANLMNCRRVTAEGLAVFRGCRNLEELNLRSTGVTDAGLAHFAQCERLTKLAIDGDKHNSGITERGLANFQHCTELTNLWLAGSGIDDAAIGHFANCCKLKDINLGQCPVTENGIAALGSLPDLETLHLDWTNVGDAVITQMKDCPKLNTLGIGWGVTDKGLAELPNLKAMTVLGLYPTPGKVTVAGAAHLKDCQRLTSLGLMGPAITDDILVEVGECTELERLGLNISVVTDAGLGHLKNCQKLRLLWGSSKAVSQEGIDAVQKALPECDVQFRVLSDTSADPQPPAATP